MTSKSTRNWLELPSDLMLNILKRLGVPDRLQNAQKVCTAWHEICKDPAMWKVVYVDSYSGRGSKEMCKQAVDRSQGQLVDLMINADLNPKLLQLSQLRRLEIVYYFGLKLSEALKKLSLLEELSLVGTNILQEDIEVAGHHCSLLKTLKVHQRIFMLLDVGEDDEVALAIGKNLPELTHLELIGSRMTNHGLRVILDGCCHLESLDLRRCVNLDLKGDLGKRCSKHIKNLKLPHDVLVCHPFLLL